MKANGAKQQRVDWDSYPKFTDLVYRPVFIEDMHQGLRKVLRAQRNPQSIEDFLSTIEPLVCLYNEYTQARSLADVCYQMNRSDDYFAAERARYRTERKEFTHLIQSVFENVFDNYDVLPGVAAVLGKASVLTVHNWQAIHHDYVEEQQLAEDQLVADLLGSDVLMSELSLLETSCDWQPPSSLPANFAQKLSKLLAVRQELADEQGFQSFIELGYRRLGYLDYHPKDALSLHQYIVDYIVPIAGAIRYEQYEGKGSGANYPENVFRASYMAVPDEAQLIKQGSSGVETVNAIFNSWVGERLPDFWSHLHQLDYVQIFDWSNAMRRSKCYSLTNPDLPVVFINRKLVPGNLADYLNIGGRAYGHLRKKQDLSYHFHQNVPLPVLRIWGKISEFLSYAGLEQYFISADAAKAWCQYHMKTQLLELPLLALLDAFQMYIHQNPIPKPEKWTEQWLLLVARFFPDLAVNEDWLAEQKHTWRGALSTYTEPFSALSKAVGIISGLTLWDEGRTKYKVAVAKFDSFCRQVSEESCLNLLLKVGIKSPFERDTLKRLAFQCSYFLGY